MSFNFGINNNDEVLNI